MKTRIAAALVEHPDINKSRRCRLLDVNRSTLYYKPVSIEEDDIFLMNLIRDIWLKRPFYGYRRTTKELQVIYHYNINRKRVKRLMSLMGIEALYPKPKTSLKALENAIYPYLLRNLNINHVNQVWMVDLTYIKLGKNFVYLIAFIDVFSRYIVGWTISESLSTEGCLTALKKALKTAKPEIINSDQGCQFTSECWIKALTKIGIKISMDGKGRCIDNVYIERFWRTIKYEAIFLNEYDDINELEKEIKKYIHFYNFERYHQGLNYEIPSNIFFSSKSKNSSSNIYKLNFNKTGQVILS
jgi:putative transposase